MKICFTSASFDAAYGGPALSVSHLAAAVAETGADAAIWAPDGSAVTSDVVPSDGKITRLDGSFQDALLRFGRPDLVHDSGVWLPHNHKIAAYCDRENLCRIVSPRGMLEPWAMQYKRLKKQIAWRLYQKRDLETAAALHATSDAEAAQFGALGLSAPVHRAPNGTDIPDEAALEAAREQRGRRSPRTALFLSRVHPKKGLPLLVKAWSDCRGNGMLDGWRLIIAGPVELDHDQEIQALVDKAGLSADIHLVGAQYGDAKTALLVNADLFILPTHSENFGIAVAEALAHGCPVITTTAAPWQALETERAGWWVDPEWKAIAQALADACVLDDRNRREMGARGRVLVAKNYGWPGIGRQMVDTYQSVLETWQRQAAA